jgi:ketosteroid isomerase-like protein
MLSMTQALRLRWATLCLVFFAAAETQAASQSEGDRQQIIALEKAWAAAAPARDVAAYNRILADDFIGQWADGTSSTKAETIESLRTSDDYQANTVRELNVRFFAGTAVVNGRFAERATSAGKDLTGEYAFIDVWVKRGGRWQCVAFQSTRFATHTQ